MNDYQRNLLIDAARELAELGKQDEQARAIGERLSIFIAAEVNEPVVAPY